MRELRNMEEGTTEKKQTGINSNITLDNIYNAIRYLGQEEQVKILENYKLTELYSIFVDNNGYLKYMSDLFNISHEYFGRAMALMSLNTEAFKESRKEKLTMREAMNQSYDGLSEEEKQKFCQGMLSKKEFYEDSCKMIMDVFGNASEAEKEDVSE